ncbi:hypothetical protein IV454_00910 [Massilia antarctica]|uniref:Solute-binding protein family 3/N-terminal domain-containing protein n=1 Tax=Massilia antarctica TaxID=2765360 RepID=A0AA49A8K0_9BURK|nr:hypothetical protein [Massilia antarctica]QPI50236.1 hypothetical protein IV454_00910 [Massilia antarctica]
MFPDRGCACLFAALLLSPPVWGAAPASASAREHGPTLRLCVDERSHLPFITSDGKGTAGELIRLAARESGVQVVFYGAPVTRCREEIRAGVADGFPTAPYTPSLLPFMSFPMRAGVPDGARAVMVARAMVFRRKGSAVGWNGERFTDRTLPVLVPFGSVLLVDRLRAMGVPMDDKGKTLDLIFSKLAAQRGDVAIGAEFSGLDHLAEPRFADQLEMLPLPFSQESYFLGISSAWYGAHAAEVERLWDAIGRIGKSAAYQDFYRKAVSDATRLRDAGLETVQ